MVTDSTIGAGAYKSFRRNSEHIFIFILRTSLHIKSCELKIAKTGHTMIIFRQECLYKRNVIFSISTFPSLGLNKYYERGTSHLVFFILIKRAPPIIQNGHFFCWLRGCRGMEFHQSMTRAVIKHRLQNIVIHT